MTTSYGNHKNLSRHNTGRERKREKGARDEQLFYENVLGSVSSLRAVVRGLHDESTYSSQDILNIAKQIASINETAQKIYLVIAMDSSDKEKLANELLDQLCLLRTLLEEKQGKDIVDTAIFKNYRTQQEESLIGDFLQCPVE